MYVLKGFCDNKTCLCGGCPGDHGCGRVLDLHFVEEDVAVLGDLDVAAARHQHLHGALWAQVSLQHLLQSLGRIDVEGQGLGRAVDLKCEMQTIFQWKFFAIL